MAALKTHLPHLKPRGVAAGLHLMIELGKNTDEQKVIEAGTKRSIGLRGASAYRAMPSPAPPGLVLGYGGLADKAVVPGVRQLAMLLREL